MTRALRLTYRLLKAAAFLGYTASVIGGPATTAGCAINLALYAAGCPHRFPVAQPAARRRAITPQLAGGSVRDRTAPARLRFQPRKAHEGKQRS